MSSGSYAFTLLLTSLFGVSRTSPVTYADGVCEKATSSETVEYSPAIYWSYDNVIPAKGQASVKVSFKCDGYAWEGKISGPGNRQLFKFEECSCCGKFSSKPVPAGGHGVVSDGLLPANKKYYCLYCDEIRKPDLVLLARKDDPKCK